MGGKLLDLLDLTGVLFSFPRIEYRIEHRANRLNRLRKRAHSIKYILGLASKFGGLKMPQKQAFLPQKQAFWGVFLSA